MVLRLGLVLSGLGMLVFSSLQLDAGVKAAPTPTASPYALICYPIPSASPSCSPTAVPSPTPSGSPNAGGPGERP